MIIQKRHCVGYKNLSWNKNTFIILFEKIWENEKIVQIVSANDIQIKIKGHISGKLSKYRAKVDPIFDTFWFCLLYTSPSPRDRG